MTAIIEFNDLELSLYRGEDRLYSAPGFAVVREGGIVFGEPALRVARIHPQQANQQYLKRMNGDPLPQPVRIAANHADLVYLHLKELAGLTGDDVVLAVPGTMNGEQLGILLGICQEAGIEVSGFVNAAVAALTTTPAPERVIYVDLFLQHVQVSELTVGSEVRHERSFEVRDCGFSNLLDGWVNLIADRFVQETRFDPLHTADSEQQLYNQVYDWVLGAHHRSEVFIEVLHGDQRRTVEIPAADLENKAQQRIDRLLDVLPAGTLALSARVARLPGMSNRLKAAGRELALLQADAVALGCAAHLGRLRTADTELKLVTRLPHERRLAPASAPASHLPTHLLCDHVARPLGDTPLTENLRQTAEGVWLLAGATASVNGETLTTDRRLCLGDVIDTGTASYTAIRLEG
ncbi:MAG: hypothetical protein AB7I04_25460 [Pseudomonadales bacterium]